MNLCTKISQIYADFLESVKSFKSFDIRTQKNQALKVRARIEKLLESVAFDAKQITDKTLIYIGSLDAEITKDWKRIPKNLRVITGRIRLGEKKLFDFGQLEYVGKTLNASEVSDFRAEDLKHVGGSILAPNAVSFNTPKLEKAGTIQAEKAEDFAVPELKTVGNVTANAAADAFFPSLERVDGTLFIGHAGRFVAPRLTHCEGDILADTASNFEAKSLINCRKIKAPDASEIHLDKLEILRATLDCQYAQVVSIPILKTCYGHIYAHRAHVFNANELETVAETIFATQATKFSAKKLRNVSIIYLSRNHINPGEVIIPEPIKMKIVWS